MISLLALLMSSVVMSLFSVVQSSTLLMYLLVSRLIRAKYLKKIVERAGKIFPSLTCLSDCPDVPGSVLAFFCTEHSEE